MTEQAGIETVIPDDAAQIDATPDATESVKHLGTDSVTARILISGHDHTNIPDGVPLQEAIVSIGEIPMQIRIDQSALDQARALGQAVSLTIHALAIDEQRQGELFESAVMRSIFRERAALVAYLAARHPSVILPGDPRTDPQGGGWPIIYVSTPHGQMSWHLNPDDLDLFGHVPRQDWKAGEHPWDGHSTRLKYERLAALTDELAASFDRLPVPPADGPAAIMAGTFVFYDDQHGGIVVVAETREHGTLKHHIPPALVRMGMKAMEGKGMFAKFLKPGE